MAKLIDPNTFRLELNNLDCIDKFGYVILPITKLNIALERSTVDAVPVRHGKWIPFEGETGVEAFGYKEYTTLGFKCSVCHANIDVSEQYFRYCPICGSKMDGERKGGDE